MVRSEEGLETFLTQLELVSKLHRQLNTYPLYYSIGFQYRR